MSLGLEIKWNNKKGNKRKRKGIENNHKYQEAGRRNRKNKRRTKNIKEIDKDLLIMKRRASIDKGRGQDRKIKKARKKSIKNIGMIDPEVETD